MPDYWYCWRYSARLAWVVKKAEEPFNDVGEDGDPNESERDLAEHREIFSKVAM